MNETENNTLAADDASASVKKSAKGRGRWIGIVLVTILGAAVAAWFMWRHLHRDARGLFDLLPPEADAYVVLDLDMLQSNPALRKLLADPPGTSLSPEYRRLLMESGFRYQSDLRQVAMAKLGMDWIGAAVVDLDGPRLISYLESQNPLKTELEGRTVYSFGSERPFRLVFIDDRLLAFSVGGDLAPLQQVFERHANRAAFSATDYVGQAGWLQRYPAGSGLWFVGRMEQLLAGNPAGPGVGPLQFGGDWWEGSRLVIANVISGPLRLDIHIENQCESAAAAGRMANAFKAVLAILQAVPEAESAAPNYAPLLAAVAIRQSGESVYLDWRWDARMLALLTGESR